MMKYTAEQRTDQFINNAMETHGHRYDYSSVIYVNAHTKVDIICSRHGHFQQIPRKHIRGSNCPECAREHSNDYRRTTVDQFLIKANKVHSYKYTYFINKINNIRTRISIRCPNHGEFTQSIISHLQGHGCSKCNKSSHIKLVSEFKYDTDWFISKARLTHGSKYDYSLVNYNKSHQKIIIRCPKHGQFEQVAREHLVGHGCNKCGIMTLRHNNARTTDEFIKLANDIHNNKYDYSESKYINKETKVAIICSEHGEFEQTPHHHINGQGCPKCYMSSGHTSILRFIYTMINSNLVTINNRDLLSPYEIDIYIQSYRLGIEFHGLYWHSYNRRETVSEQYRHYKKADIAANADITMLQIYENEWNNQSDLLKSMISNKLMLSDKLYARNFRIAVVDNTDIKPFYSLNHIQGHRNSKINIALMDNDSNIVACMSFSKHHRFDYELIRYACVIDCCVVGGPSRLFTYFVRNYCPRSVLSYADRRYSRAEMYLKLGFRCDGVTKPNYCYVSGNKVYSRHKFQKHRLSSKLDKYDSQLSESVNMFANGYRRLWDAGHYRMIWKNDVID